MKALLLMLLTFGVLFQIQAKTVTPSSTKITVERNAPNYGGCYAHLISPRGYLIARFYDYTCRNALRACNYDLMRRQRLGQDRFSRCVIADSRPPQEMIVRTCTYKLMERDYYGTYIIDYFTTTLRGIRGTGVQERACANARRNCENRRRYGQFCIQ